MIRIIACIKFISILIILTSILACEDNNEVSLQFSQALTENAFANDSDLRADPEGGVIVDLLEPPDSDIPEIDLGEVGVDEIPFTYPQTVQHTLCWEDEDVDAMHFMELMDSEGNEVLRLDVNGECVTETIEAGDYVMIIHHDGRTGTIHPIFIIPNPEDLEQANHIEGLISVFNVLVANMVNVIQNVLSKDARAQTIQDNIKTLISTNSCISCDLRRAELINLDLSGAILTGADLTNAFLNDANLSGADLTSAILTGALLIGTNMNGADLTGADLTSADLTGANLIGAVLANAILSSADLTGADLTNANLSSAFLIGANLTGANLPGADLTNANLNNAFLIGTNLTGTILTGANLSGVRWCSGICRCPEDSIGTCGFCGGVSICQ